MRHEVHVHADIPILEGVSRRQIEQASKLLFVGPTAHAIHEAQRRCMIEDVAAILARQFEKDKVTEVTALVNDLFDRDWKEKASQEKKPERAFESYTRPSRKNLH